MNRIFVYWQRYLKVEGEVSEWLKEHAWKVCIGLKLIAGSNPALSAKESKS